MKLLFQASDSDYVNQIKLLLESAGIPVFLSNENSFRMKQAMFMNGIGVWVYLESQYEEAIKLINNPDYEVRHPVDLDEFNALLKSRKSIEILKFISMRC